MLVRTRKELADAALSSGARVVAAGGGRPQRITTAADVVLVGVAELRGGVVFDPDGLHVWTNLRTTGAVRKTRISDSATVLSLTTNVSLPENITRALGSTKAFVAGSGNSKILVVDLAAGTIADFVSPVASPYHAVEGSTGKAWVRSTNASSATYTEVTLATGLATGRTLSAGWDLVYDAANGKLYLLLTNGSVQRIAESTLSVELTWSAPSTAAHQVPFYSNGLRALAVDASRRPIVADTVTAAVYRYAADSNAIDKRLFVGASEFGQPPGSTVTAARYQRQFLAFSDDGNQAAWLQLNSAGGSISDALDVRVVDTRTARARWSIPNASTAAAAVKEIGVPGAHGNEWDAVVTPPAGQPTTYDHRRTRFYWSLDGGSSRTEFTPGDDLSLAGLSVSPGGTLTIDADMTSWERPLPLSPWVGGTNGEGIGVVWDDPDADPVVEPPSGGGVVTSTTWEAIRDNYMTVIRALQPRRMSNLKFDFQDGESLVEWATRNPSSTLFRKAEFLAVGEQAPQAEVIEPNAQERHLLAVLTVAYPVLENLVGPEKRRELEDVMRDDAAQLHDALFSSGNYLPGQSACFVTIAAPTRVNPQLYLQTFNLQVDFYEATFLTF